MPVAQFLLGDVIADNFMHEITQLMFTKTKVREHPLTYTTSKCYETL